MENVLYYSNYQLGIIISLDYGNPNEGNQPIYVLTRRSSTSGTERKNYGARDVFRAKLDFVNLMINSIAK